MRATIPELTMCLDCIKKLHELAHARCKLTVISLGVLFAGCGPRCSDSWATVENEISKQEQALASRKELN